MEMDKTFAISYKLRYAETSDWKTEYLEAINEEQAFNFIAKSRKILTEEFKNYSDWHWEEGVWSSEFRNIELVKNKYLSSLQWNGHNPQLMKF